MRIEDVHSTHLPASLAVCSFYEYFCVITLDWVGFLYSHHLSRILKNSARTKSAPIAAHSLSRSSWWRSSNQYQMNLKRVNLIGFDIFALTLNSQHVFLIQSVV